MARTCSHRPKLNATQHAVKCGYVACGFPCAWIGTVPCPLPLVVPRQRQGQGGLKGQEDRVDLQTLIESRLKVLDEEGITPPARRKEAEKAGVYVVTKYRLSQLRKNSPPMVRPLGRPMIFGLAFLLGVPPRDVAMAMLHTIGVLTAEDEAGERVIVVRCNDRTPEQVEYLVHVGECAVHHAEVELDQME
jgi:hypothetical protein